MRIPQLSIRWDFYMRIPRLSIRWVFYMRIPRLSILLTHIEFLYGDLSAINIAHSYEIFIWGFLSYQNHEWASNRWTFNHQWALNRWAFNYASKLTVKYWISALLNKFSEFLTLLRSLIASRKNCPKSSYSAVYDLVMFSFLLIHAFSRAKDVSMRLKSDEYEDKRVKMISTASHIRIRFSFQWIRALSRINIDLRALN